MIRLTPGGQRSIPGKRLEKVFVPRETKPVCFISTIPSVDRICTYTPFWGVIDWADFAAALRDIHYEGVFSLETPPSPKLSDKLFCESARLLAKCARQIIVSQV